jgi:dipeptidyl aminopeptidase/acylaminoacyl peptidase
MPDVDLDRSLGALDAIEAPDLWGRATSTTPRHAPSAPGRWGRGTAIATAAILSLASLGFVFLAFEGGDRPMGVQRDNGPFVVAASGLDGRPPQYDSLFVVGLDGAGFHRITERVGIGQPTWSPDGSRIAFVGGPRRGGGDVFVVDADGSNVLRLTETMQEEGSPAWSPDGKRIVFVRDADVWVMNADGTDPIRLVESGEGYARWPAWSPDGRQIAFVRPFDHGIVDTCPTNTGTGVFVMDADGSDVRRLTIEGCRHRVAWSRTGDSLAISTGQEIAVIDLEGEVLRSFGFPSLPRDPIGFGMAGPVRSPDGRLLALSLRGDIWTLRTGTGEWTQVTRDTGFAITDFDWGPASRLETRPSPQALSVQEFTVGPSPGRLLVSAGAVWVSRPGGVTRVDPVTGELTRIRVHLEEGIQYGAVGDVAPDSGLAFGNGLVWVTAEPYFAGIDPLTNEITDSILFESGVTNIAFEGRRLFYGGSAEGNGKLILLDPVTGQFRSIGLGPGAYPIPLATTDWYWAGAASPDGRPALERQSRDGSQTQAIEGVTAVDSMIEIDGSVWVAGDGTLWRVDAGYDGPPSSPQSTFPEMVDDAILGSSPIGDPALLATGGGRVWSLSGTDADPGTPLVLQEHEPGTGDAVGQPIPMPYSGSAQLAVGPDGYPWITFEDHGVLVAVHPAPQP